MFHKADWTQPQVGGLLSQLIVREEATLQRAPDRNHKVRANHRELSMHARQESFLRKGTPSLQVQHIWDYRVIESRPSSWKARLIMSS